MQRGAAGWKIATDAQIMQGDLLAELRTLPGKKSVLPTAFRHTARVNRCDGNAALSAGEFPHDVEGE